MKCEWFGQEENVAFFLFLFQRALSCGFCYIVFKLFNGNRLFGYVVSSSQRYEEIAFLS